MTAALSEPRDSTVAPLPARTIRSLHVVPSLTFGGAARGAMEIVRGLQQRPGHEVALCILGHEKEHPLLDSITEAPTFLGMPVHESGHLMRRWKRLRRLIREKRPDVLHAHLWPAARVLGWASIGLPGRRFVHIRDTPPAFEDRSWKGQLKRSLLSGVLTLMDARFLSVSQAAKDFSVRHLGLDPQRIDVILNGIETAPFEAVPTFEASVVPGVLTLGTAGRLVEPKGHAVLIEAVQLVRQRGHDVRLKIAGSGGLEVELRSQVETSGLADAITFVGTIEEMPQFYAGIDVFVLPSLSSEGLPRVVLETMCSGRTVIGTHAAGVGEVVTPGETGFLVPPDDAAALAGVIEQLAREPQRCLAMGRATRDDALRKFQCRRVVDEVAVRYERLMIEP